MENDVKSTNKKINNILIALRSENFGAIRLYLETKSINVDDWLEGWGATALHLSIGHGSEEFAASVAHELLRHGADANAAAADGLTPVHVAAAWGRLSVLHLLLLHGGDPWVQDEDRKNAFNHAFEGRAWPVIEMLHQFQLARASGQFQKCCRLSISPIQIKNYFPTKEYKQTLNNSVYSKINSPETIERMGQNTNNITFWAEPIKQIANSPKDEKNHIYFSKDLEMKQATLEINVEEVKETEKSNIPEPPLLNVDTICDKLNGWKLNQPEEKLNGTYIIEKATESEMKDSKVDLYAELTAAVQRRSLRMSGIKKLPPDTSFSMEDGNITTKSQFNDAVDSSKIDISSDIIDPKESSIISNDIDEVDGYQDSILMFETDARKIEVVDVSDMSSAYLSLPNDVTGSDSFVSCNNSAPKNPDTSEGDEIRAQLQQMGVNPGPIVPSTLPVYRRLLTRLRLRGQRSPIKRRPFASPVETHFSPQQVDNSLLYPSSYSLELANALDNVYSFQELAHFEQKIRDNFDCPAINRRGGSSKTSFNYLLLDGRISRNLPSRAASLGDPLEVFRQFLAAVFYIGKGQANRPYAHLHDALRAWRDHSEPKSPKEAVILDIWRANAGVVCLQLFHNILAAEAFTREAAMIDAMGRQNLRNLRRGEYYGCCESWSGEERRYLGVYLLFRAKTILLQDGERALKPFDL